jgi:hypothetical protein
MKRRDFIKTTGYVTAGIGAAGNLSFTTASSSVNNLPRWKGFNLLDYFSPQKNGGGRSTTTENGIGYALWNFRGDFGILDSGRKDIQYEDWYGHKLDRKMLKLLMNH